MRERDGSGGILLAQVVFAMVWAGLVCPIALNQGNNNPMLFPMVALAAAAFVVKAFGDFVLSGGLRGFVILMLALAVASTVGLVLAGTPSAIKYVGYIIAVIMFVCAISSGAVKVTFTAAVTIWFIAVCACFVGAMLGYFDVGLQNTLSGLLVFSFAFVALCFLRSHDSGAGASGASSRFAGTVMVLGGIFSLIIVMISKARTALIVAAIIGVIYFVAFKVHPSRKTLKKTYYALVAIIVVCLFVYVNAKSFGWYEVLNNFSQEYFGKNIDSSRPALWGEAISALGSDVLLGLGTGVQPDGIFAGKSFHNSFLQILVQNGMIGLVLFVAALGALWMQIAEGQIKKATLFALSVFAGILIYNCFETTLLCNKLALGFIEWMIVAYAIGGVEADGCGEDFVTICRK